MLHNMLNQPEQYQEQYQIRKANDQTTCTDQNAKRFKRTLIYFDTDTQCANMNLFVFGSCFRLLAVILFQIIIIFLFFSCSDQFELNQIRPRQL